MTNNTIKHIRITGYAGVAQRRRIRLRDNCTCSICKRIANPGEVDHRIALDERGSNDDSNLWLLCIDCHKDKTAKDRNYTIKSGSNVSGLPTNTNHHWNT